VEIRTVAVPTAVPAVTAGAGIRPPAHAGEADILLQVLGAEAVDRRMVAEVGRRTAAAALRRMATAVAADTDDKRLIHIRWRSQSSRALRPSLFFVAAFSSFSCAGK
jgi:hypothetical protein